MGATCLTALGATHQPRPEPGPGFSRPRNLRVSRQIAPQALACLECHRRETPGLFTDWVEGAHARAGVTCLDCHLTDEVGPTVSQGHFKYYERRGPPWQMLRLRMAVTAVVTPRACARCHFNQVRRFSLSKHAHTREIVAKSPGRNLPGQVSAVAVSTGCERCHGSVVRFKNGSSVRGTWPNEGIGRLNPDGSRGNCTACHTRHRFDRNEARRPAACAKCHSGPAHPQWAIYQASKHGTIYATAGKHQPWGGRGKSAWAFRGDSTYRTPTCAVCHISGNGSTLPSDHNVSARLSWELQTPLSVRPENFKPYPASSNWRTARQKMKLVCQPCHGRNWIEAHFRRFDLAVRHYNRDYYRPVLKMIELLSKKGLLDKKKMSDQHLEIEYDELWRQAGRRARMGAAMMAPDYTWWHGFYECKKRFTSFMREARVLLKSAQPALMPKASRSTERSPEKIPMKGQSRGRHD